MVIIVGSSMATGVRVGHHLKAFAPDKRKTILLVGFGGTRGASLAAGAPSIRIHGEDVPVRAKGARIDSLSAHATRANWKTGCAPCLRYRERRSSRTVSRTRRTRCAS